MFRTVFYLPALVPPVAATLGFVYLLNPSTGPVNVILGWVGIEGPLWFNDPGWSKPSLVMLGLWGVGTTMIIFLAAILDVPRHLYESAELDGANALQRLRWVTLPTISPVILFAVVLGVIASLQYFTQAHVAASVAAGSAVAGRDDDEHRDRLPGGLDALLPDPRLQPRVPRLQHGLRLGDGDAPARRRVRGHRDHHLELAAGRALPGAGAVTRSPTPRPRVARGLPRAVRPPAPARRDRRPQPAHRAAIAFVAPSCSSSSRR